MSYMRYMTLYSFCFFNPSWKIHFIKNNNKSKRNLIGTMEKQDKTEYCGSDYSYLINKLNINVISFENSMIDLPTTVVDTMSDVHIKDILNWKLLYDNGGVVSDMDILFIKPITDEIFDDVDVGLVCFDNYPKKDYIPVSFMFGANRNSFFKNVYHNAINNYKADIYESCGTLCIKEKNINEIRNNYPDLNVQRLNDSIVFPFIDYPWVDGIEILYNGDYSHLISVNSIGIHWYGGAPLSQHFNNIINDETIDSVNNTMSVAIRRLCNGQGINL
mgnify:CR=1 FL=1